MLNNVPLNTDRIFVMARTTSGCEIYVPITKADNSSNKQKQLQEYLKTQN